MVKDTDNGLGVPGSNPVSDTKKILIRKLARLHLWRGKALSYEESESLVVRNSPKIVGLGLDWKEDFSPTDVEIHQQRHQTNKLNLIVSIQTRLTKNIGEFWLKPDLSSYKHEIMPHQLLWCAKELHENFGVCTTGLWDGCTPLSCGPTSQSVF